MLKTKEDCFVLLKESIQKFRFCQLLPTDEFKELFREVMFFKTDSNHIKVDENNVYIYSYFITKKSMVKEVQIKLNKENLIVDGEVFKFKSKNISVIIDFFNDIDLGYVTC